MVIQFDARYFLSRSKTKRRTQDTQRWPSDFCSCTTREPSKIKSNHSLSFHYTYIINQFVDPIVLMRECQRRVSFLIAEKSMHQKGIGTFARMVNASKYLFIEKI